MKKLANRPARRPAERRLRVTKRCSERRRECCAWRRRPDMTLVPGAVAASLAELRKRVAALDAADGRLAAAERALGEVAADVAALNVHVGALIAVSGRAEAQKRAAAALVKALDDAGVLTECAGKGGGVG